jgi:hypothetical protein
MRSQWSKSEWRAEPQIVVGAIFPRLGARGSGGRLHRRPTRVGEFYEQVAFDGRHLGLARLGKSGPRRASPVDQQRHLRQRVTESLARRLVLGQGTDAAHAWVDTIEDPVFKQTNDHAHRERGGPLRRRRQGGGLGDAVSSRRDRRETSRIPAS